MPNVTWLEPQILLDLLALNIYAAENNLPVPGEPRAAVVSPWLSDVEIELGPSVWHQYLNIGRTNVPLRIGDALVRLRRAGWAVDIAVLQYGQSSCGLTKRSQDFAHEVTLLKRCFAERIRIRLCPNLHAKGIVTPLGVITGGTNYTRSGLYLQSQNSNYFAHDHAEYASNRGQLLSYCDCVEPIISVASLEG